MSRFQFVADHRDTFEVKQLCQAVEINRSSYYAWEAAADGRAQRDAADAALAERIKPFHEPTTPTAHHGSPRTSTTPNPSRSASTTSESRA